MWKHKGYELPQDAPLIIGALSRLIYYEIMIHLKPLPVILAGIRETSYEGSSLLSREDLILKLDKLWRVCGFGMVRLMRNPRTCLRRSLVLYRWCRMHGVECRLFVGVGKDNDALKGHAWISVYGRIYREDPLLLAREYTVMLEG
ncbi:MAG TPA: lasso peptide biosynthesis B2 protein [Smithella sp.]|nr:lasso peptide biosynthesis B2 protein [Smithella sp.]